MKNVKPAEFRGKAKIRG